MSEAYPDVRLPKVTFDRYEGDALCVIDAICAYVWERDISDSERIARFWRLTPGQRAVLPTTSVHGEVLNGGLEQYLHNSGSMFFHEAVEGLVIMGAHRHADLLRRASQVFPGGIVPRDRTERVAALFRGDEERYQRFLEAQAWHEAHPMTPMNVDWGLKEYVEVLEQVTSLYFRLEDSDDSLEWSVWPRYVNSHLADFVRP